VIAEPFHKRSVAVFAGVRTAGIGVHRIVADREIGFGENSFHVNVFPYQIHNISSFAYVFCPLAGP